MEDAGDGPPVVLLHGLGGSSNSFECQMPALEGCRVLRPDLPGAGRSAMRPGLSTIADFAGTVREMVTSVGIKRAHFAGHSMGGLIVQHLAADHPELVKSLTLFAPILEPLVAARQVLKERADMARRGRIVDVAHQISMGSVGAPARAANPVTQAYVRESIARQDPRSYAVHCEALSNAEAVDLSKIQCPTLIIAGELDPVAPVKMVQGLNNGIAGSKLEILKNISHWMMLEDPQRSNDLMRGHIEQVEG